MISLLETNHGEKSSRSVAIDLVKKYYENNGHDPYKNAYRGYESDGWFGIFQAIAEAAEKNSGKMYY